MGAKIAAVVAGLVPPPPYPPLQVEEGRVHSALLSGGTSPATTESGCHREATWQRAGPLKN
jgi:hypothetical protein